MSPTMYTSPTLAEYRDALSTAIPGVEVVGRRSARSGAYLAVHDDADGTGRYHPGG